MAEKTADNGGPEETENERIRIFSVVSPFLCFSVVCRDLRTPRPLETRVAVLARYDHFENAMGTPWCSSRRASLSCTRLSAMKRCTAARNGLTKWELRASRRCRGAEPFQTASTRVSANLSSSSTHWRIRSKPARFNKAATVAGWYL
jgi:hypothetical protein